MARMADSNIPVLEPFGHALTPKQTALVAIFAGLHDVEPAGDDFDVRMIMWAEYVRHKVGTAHARGVFGIVVHTT